MFHDVKQFHDPRRQNPFQNSSFQDFPRSVVCRRQSNHSISLPKVLGLPRLFTFDRTRIKVLDWNMRNAYKWLQTQFYESFNTNIGRMKFCNGTVMQTTGTIYIYKYCYYWKADPAQEARRRISSTMPILKRLDIETNRTEAENGNYYSL